MAENQGREETPDYRKDKDIRIDSKQPKVWAPASLILLVAASLYGVPGSQAQKSFEGTHWLCFIQAPNPDPSVVASGLGSYENVAFPMVDRYFSGRCQFQEKMRNINYFKLL